ncbi:MAG: PIN domain-containing protein [Lentisphaerae bacterium]|nr:PIN domain-containing protein [Lentisphaerota bacterium]
MQIFIDTAPLIYLAEGAVERRERVALQLSQWVRDGALLSTSTLTLLEVLVLPKREGDRARERTYRALLMDLFSAPLVALDQAVADVAADLRATHGLRTPDAVQLASALVSGCTIFYTNDRRLKRYAILETVLVEPDTP